MTGEFRRVAANNGTDDLGLIVRIELEASPDGGTKYRAIAMHANEDGSKGEARLPC
jgi:hypothetical protein